MHPERKIWRFIREQSCYAEGRRPYQNGIILSLEYECAPKEKDGDSVINL